MFDLPEIGEIIYRPMRAYRTILGTSTRITDIPFRPQREKGLICDVEYSFEYDAWFLTKGRGLRAFIDEEVPAGVTHFEVTKLHGTAIRMRPLPPDEGWLATQFPSAGGWDQGVLRLRRIAAENPDLFRDLIPDEALWQVVTSDQIRSLLALGLSHNVALTGSDVLKALDTLRQFVEEDFDRFGSVKDTLKAAYIETLEAIVPKE